MKRTVKSHIALPVSELELIEQLRLQLKLPTKVDVVLEGIRLLKQDTDRASLRKAFREASRRDPSVESSAARAPGLADHFG